MNKNTVLTAVAVIALAVAGVLFAKNLFYSKRPDTPDTTYWICVNRECNHRFELSVDKLKQERDLPQCPKCNQRTTVRAYQCPSCKGTYEAEGHGLLPKNCPLCKAAIPRPQIGKSDG
ncbi:MAG: hypothetical protein CHACPFDD_00921 [Phycisphaerae bacterium]|nr:hypothetical protein [Phycisphaerae bacterium]